MSCAPRSARACARSAARTSTRPAPSTTTRPRPTRAGRSSASCASSDVDATHEAFLVALYLAFNDRDLEALKSRLHADVDWPNAWEGARVRGRDAVIEYWRRQFAEIDPSVVPVGFGERDDGPAVVGVDQVVRSLDGELLSRATVRHVYRVRDGLMER